MPKVGPTLPLEGLEGIYLCPLEKGYSDARVPRQDRCRMRVESQTELSHRTVVVPANLRWGMSSGRVLWVLPRSCCR